MLGLDAAGKTTILYKLHIGEVLSTVPTIGGFYSIKFIFVLLIFLNVIDRYLDLRPQILAQLAEMPKLIVLDAMTGVRSSNPGPPTLCEFLSNGLLFRLSNKKKRT
jgi:hypothetical protein